MALSISCNAFGPGELIPKEYTCDGNDISPHVEWKNVPPAAKSLVLIVDDPDAPRGVWNHWLLYDIPPSTAGLPKGAPAPAEARAGINDFGKAGYGGPCPPPGHGSHRYYFRLYALDDTLRLPVRVRRSQLEDAMSGHILEHAEYMGRYQRK
jgi:Raf kinase inhibitor-like YbhB/YbcL family protein